MTVYLVLDEWAAKELADWLDGTDAHLSVGDRLFLAMELRRQLDDKSN